jgi:hypothetical protein
MFAAESRWLLPAFPSDPNPAPQREAQPVDRLGYFDRLIG